MIDRGSPGLIEQERVDRPIFSKASTREFIAAEVVVFAHDALKSHEPERPLWGGNRMDV